MAASLPAMARAADPVPPAPTGLDVTLGLGVVPLSLELPDIQLSGITTNGSVPLSLDGDAEGVAYAVSLSTELGELGGVPLFAEVAAAFADADESRSSFSSQLAGTGTFAFRLGSSAGDTITLGTAATAAGGTATTNVIVTDPAGATANVAQATFSPAGPNLTNLFAESPTANGGIAFGNAVTTGAPVSGTAIGFAADANGALIVATGDLGAIRVDNLVEQDVDYTELEARLIGAVPLGGSGWVATPSIAPAYRYLRRDVDVLTQILLPTNPATNARAGAFLQTNDDLTAHYAGGSVGIGAVGPIPGDLILSVGANAGLLGMFADYEGTSSATVLGITTTTIAFDPVSDELDELAYFARGSVGVTKQLGGFSLSLGGQAEYLSDVPTLLRNPNVALGTPGAFSATGGEASVRLGSDDAVILSGSLSVSLAF